MEEVKDVIISQENINLTPKHLTATTAEEFLSLVREEVQDCVLLEDVDRIFLVAQIDMVLHYVKKRAGRRQIFGLQR